uniref:Uncharacterized protein n=1 Tax=Timema douglasi TaxID=61478 RepID=A0A7R8VMF5_TIMDO|nr:unnamed protein product [Timema douglasi]
MTLTTVPELLLTCHPVGKTESTSKTARDVCTSLVLWSKRSFVNTGGRDEERPANPSLIDGVVFTYSPNSGTLGSSGSLLLRILVNRRSSPCSPKLDGLGWLQLVLSPVRADKTRALLMLVGRGEGVLASSGNIIEYCDSASDVSVSSLYEMDPFNISLITVENEDGTKTEPRWYCELRVKEEPQMESEEELNTLEEVKESLKTEVQYFDTCPSIKGFTTDGLYSEMNSKVETELHLAPLSSEMVNSKIILKDSSESGLESAYVKKDQKLSCHIKCEAESGNDDAMMSQDKEELKKITEAVKQQAAKVGLHLNEDKTEYMLIPRREQDQDPLSSDAMPRAVVEGIPRKTCPLGIPRLWWWDELEKDLTQLGVAGDWRKEALDRPRWRQLVKAACDLQGL